MNWRNASLRSSSHQRALGAACCAALCLGAAAAPAAGEVVDFSITIDASQETPANGSTATGTGTATLDTATNLFSWSISFSGLSSAENNAHFHGPAPQCVPAGVQIGLPLGSPIAGAATVTAQQASDILNGLWYVNIHSVNFGGGEIRGQVVPAPVDNPIPTPIPTGTIHLQLETIATGLAAPNWGTFAPGDSTPRLFVVDQNGILWAINLSTLAKSVFLDASSKLVPLGIVGPNSYDERGFLGVAFHPSYQTNGLLYTFTSEPASAPADFSTQPVGVPPDCQTVIREWHVPDPGNPGSVVDPLSTRVLMRIDKPQFNHNAGAIAFGPDGMLYITTGDGGGADDKDGEEFFGGQPIVGHGCAGNGQNTLTALGKIFRIDPTGTNSANGQYGVPADNPFVGNASFLPEIYAYGFRNPFRMSFDTTTGALYVGDVGQNNIEEIDVVTAGANCGWRLKEGTFFFQPNGNSAGYAESRPQSAPAGLLDPIAEYDHDEGIAILGGFVSHGAKVGPLLGRYVFGELAPTFAGDGRMFHLDASNQIKEFIYVGQDALNLFVLGFGQDAAGEVYLMANSGGIPFGTTGVVLRLATKPGDINANGVTDIDDLFDVINSWGPCPAPCPTDIVPSGEVDVDDLFKVINNWG